jgi:hypothetical protein
MDAKFMLLVVAPMLLVVQEPSPNCIPLLLLVVEPMRLKLLFTWLTAMNERFKDQLVTAPVVNPLVLLLVDTQYASQYCPWLKLAASGRAKYCAAEKLLKLLVKKPRVVCDCDELNCVLVCAESRWNVMPYVDEACVPLVAIE